MIVLQNEKVTVTIAEKGAELQSITKNGVEYLWHGDPTYWGRRAPLLFPICGALKQDTYTYEGTAYTLEKHGYARHQTFEVERATDTEAVFLLRSDENSLKQFPFVYEVRVGYRLQGDTVAVSYAVKNPEDRPLYFSIGAHEAYACPEGVGEYEIEFDKVETLDTTPDPLHSYDTERVMENGKVLPLKADYFAVDALIFNRCVQSEALTLRHKKTGRGVRVGFAGFPYLLLWQKYDAPFLCVEPWCGYPDTPDHEGDITQKLGIQRVDGGDTFCREHTITLL